MKRTATQPAAADTAPSAKEPQRRDEAQATSERFAPRFAPMDDEHYRSENLVLGIGNLLWADEGFGIRALEQLHARWVFPPNTRLLDGGTQGLYLLPYVEGCQRLLIFDAIDFGLAPGTLRLLLDAEVPAYLGVKKMSLHQTGFQEVLSLAMLKGWQPQAIALIGVQPQTLDDYGGSLSLAVRARLDEAVDQAVELLQRWGAPPQPRTTAASSDSLSLPCLRLDAYESHVAGKAFTPGDVRFLNLSFRKKSA